jgi:bacillithiol system protein YtxJ
MHWLNLTEVNQLEAISNLSFQKPQILFKHSTRCSISTMAEGRLYRSAVTKEADFYYLDLLKHRDVSNAIADKYKIHHESPQILVISQGECILEQTHSGINMEEILEVI